MLTQNRISDVLTFLYDLSAFWLQTATSFSIDQIIQLDYNIKVAFDNQFSFILKEFHMKIDDILKKCIEIPGISIKSSETSTELLFKSTSGKGSMTFYSLFPGF